MHLNSIANVVSSINNSLLARRRVAFVRKSKKLRGILDILRNEGFIDGYYIFIASNNISYYVIKLKYYQNTSVVHKFKLISKPGNYRYMNWRLLKTLKTRHCIIISTSLGIMTHKEALALNLGGLVLIEVLL